LRLPAPTAAAAAIAAALALHTLEISHYLITVCSSLSGPEAVSALAFSGRARGPVGLLKTLSSPSSARKLFSERPF
jgi:hypothetical protein